MPKYNNIVFLKRKTGIRNYRSFAKKYPKLEPHIINLKLSYKKEFKVVQLLFVITGRWNINQKFKAFYKPVERYFDVIIIPYKYMGESIEPVQSFKILGDETQCYMAARFLYDLYYTYFGCLEERIKATKLSRKQSRRLRRRWNIKGELKDARYTTSRFKERLSKYLLTPLLESLERIEKTYRKSFIRGLLRTKRIKRYFYKKYGKTWRKKI